MLELYLEHRTGREETFSEFSRRIGTEKYAQLLGKPLVKEEAPAERNVKLQSIFNEVVAWAE